MFPPNLWFSLSGLVTSVGEVHVPKIMMHELGEILKHCWMIFLDMSMADT